MKSIKKWKKTDGKIKVSMSEELIRTSKVRHYIIFFSIQKYSLSKYF